jgi:hypothetical protein
MTDPMLESQNGWTSATWSKQEGGSSQEILVRYFGESLVRTSTYGIVGTPAPAGRYTESLDEGGLRRLPTIWLCLDPLDLTSSLDDS